MSTYSFVKDLEKLRISEEDIPTSKSLPKNYRGISRVDPPYTTKNPITMDYSVKTPELHDIVGHNAAKKKTTTQISRFAEHIPSVILPENQRIDVNPTQEVHENLVRRYQYDQRQVNRAKRDGLTIGGKKTKKRRNITKKTKKSKKKKNTRSKKHKTHKRKIRKYKKSNKRFKTTRRKRYLGGTRSPQEILNQIREGRQQIANVHQHVLQEEDSLASNSWASPDTSMNSSFESTYSTNSDDGETTREDISFEEEEPADDDDPLNQGFILEEGETL
jgi:hypothetical protein